MRYFADKKHLSEKMCIRDRAMIEDSLKRFGVILLALFLIFNITVTASYAIAVPEHDSEGSIAAVSYTHLDVYKRQAYHSVMQMVMSSAMSTDLPRPVIHQSALMRS